MCTGNVSDPVHQLVITLSKFIHDLIYFWAALSFNRRVLSRYYCLHTQMRLFGILCILGLTAYGQAADRTPRVEEDSSADQQEEELTPHQIEILEESADLFAKYDANSDGGVTLEEMVAAAQ